MRPRLNVATAIVWLSSFLPLQHSAGESNLFTSLDGNPKVTYQDALTRCQNKLPDDQTAHDELVDYMRRTGVGQAWLGCKRSNDPWTWITGQAVETSLLLEDRDGYEYGVMEHDGRLEGRPSHHTLPVICQFDGVPCSQTYAAAYCASSNQTTLLVAPALQGWYTARALCLHLSGDLATFQHPADVKLAKTLIKKLPGWPFWIGARRNQWKTPKKKEELYDMSTNQWEAEQPGTGDCVVIQQTGGRGLWRSADCTSANSVVCVNHNYGKKTPVVPRQNTTKRVVADISIYTGSEKNNLTMKQLCERKSAESVSDDEFVNSVDQIALYMKAAGAISAWLPWEQHTLLNWTWLNGDTYSNRVMEDKGPLCATPDRIFGPSKMYAIPCHANYVGYICQFSDQRQCWQTHHPYNCFHLGSTTLVVGIRIQSWYVASALCTALGGQLAQLPEEWMIKALLAFNKHRRTLQTTDFFYVGVQKAVWQTEQHGLLKIQNLWDIGNPFSDGRCSVMQLKGESLLYRSVNCTETHAVLCRAPLRTTSVTMESTTIARQEYNITNGVNGTLVAGESLQSQTHLPLHIILPIFALILVVVGLFSACCILRHKKARWKQQGEEPCSSAKQRPVEDVPLLALPIKRDDVSYSRSEEVGWERTNLEDLHLDRHKALLDNADALKEKILLEEGDLLEKLVKRKLLSDANKRFIEEGHSNSDKISRLINIIRKKDDTSYEILCDCLWASRQENVVTTYLYTQVDLLSARKKVIEYIQTEFRDIHMYTADELCEPVPIDKIYVNVTWERVKHLEGSLTGHSSEGNPSLQSHFDIFNKMQTHGDTRMTISGIAGSGKTSFMKHVSRKWVQVHKQISFSTEDLPLKYYYIVIPIILRLIRTEMSLSDVLKDQIPHITDLEAYAICLAMSVMQRKLLVIFDGYDELTAHNVIDPIIRKQVYANVTLVVTTRPHGITMLKRLGSESIEQLLRIYGFTREQIEKYIKLFFELPGKSTEQGVCLINELLAKDTYLTEMARIPIQLEIMCIVWSVKQKLGNNILDLYQNFIECLDSHMKRKRVNKSDSHKIIMCLCRVANCWTKHGSLEKIFPHQKLSKEFPNQFTSMVDFGCLVKYHPSTHLDKSFWSFSHLTLQEYFLALGICQLPMTKEEIMKRFSSVSKLERLEIVLKFICGMDPSIGNEILQAVLKDTTDKEECKRLLDLIQKLIPEYKSREEINLSFPRLILDS